MNIDEVKQPECIINAVREAEAITQKPLVVIRCCTYKHGPYLARALRGFVMQKTSFHFVAVVHDDASPDNTAEILKEYEAAYPDIIKPIYDPVNRYTEGTMGLLMDKVISAYNPKYEAICEGDDYWTDPLKLQKQVDFLDTHPDYVLAYTDRNVDCEGVISHSKPVKKPSNDEYKHFLLDNPLSPILTLTVMFRESTYAKLHKYWRNEQFLLTDICVWIELAQEGKFKYIDEVTSCYGVLPKSATHSPDILDRIRFDESARSIFRMYRNIYNYKVTEKDLDKKYIIRFLKLAYLNNRKDIANKYYQEAKENNIATFKIRLLYFIAMRADSSVLKTVLKIKRKLS